MDNERLTAVHSVSVEFNFNQNAYYGQEKMDQYERLQEKDKKAG